MMKKRLIVPIETLARELDARLYLSLKLLNSQPDKWEVIFGHHRKCGKYMNTKRHSHLGFIYLSSGLSTDISHYRKIIKDGGKYCLMDEEGGIFPSHDSDNYPRGGRDNKCLDYVENIFFWGEKERDNWFHRHRGMEKTKAIVSGNPRFDISKKHFTKYFEKINSMANRESSYVLIIFAFGTANSMIDNELESKYWASSNKDGKSFLKKWKPTYRYQKKSFSLYVDGIIRLIKENSDEAFLIRPHPVEDIEIYKKLFDQFPNVRIDNSGPVQNWFPKTKLFIHNGCTTAIEAAVNGLRPICFAPYIEEECIQKLTFEVSTVLSNYDELNETFSELIRSNNKLDNDSINLEHVKQHIHNVDLDSVDIIVTRLNKIEFKQFVEISIYIYSFMRQIKNLVPDRLKALVRRSSDKTNGERMSLDAEEKREVSELLLKRQLVKFPGIKLEELDERQKLLVQYNLIARPVDIDQLDENLFRLS